jgi:hypothetical protein
MPGRNPSSGEFNLAAIAIPSWYTQLIFARGEPSAWFYLAAHSSNDINEAIKIRVRKY